MINMKTWYCEYKSHVRIHDYFSIMINNFPVLAIRRFDFDLHSKEPTSTICVGVLGFSKNFKPYELK